MSTMTPGFLRQVATDAQAEADALRERWASGKNPDPLLAREGQALEALAVAARELVRVLEAKPEAPQLERDLALVRRLCEIDEGLTEWEVSFVENISKQVERGRPLSTHQRERAEQLDVRR